MLKKEMDLSVPDQYIFGENLFYCFHFIYYNYVIVLLSCQKNSMMIIVFYPAFIFAILEKINNISKCFFAVLPNGRWSLNRSTVKSIISSTGHGHKTYLAYERHSCNLVRLGLDFSLKCLEKYGL